MRSWAFAALGCLLAAVVEARAADIAIPTAVATSTTAPASPPPQVYSWTGLYYGINGGGGFASGSGTATIVDGPLAGTSEKSGSLSGAVAGGQLGFNYQIQQFVFGMEGDVDWSSQSRSGNLGPLTNTVKLPWFATVRARVGVAVDRVLMYGTAGISFTDVSDKEDSFGVFNVTSTNPGWTVGIGSELAIFQNWTARIEYLFVNTNVKLSGPVNFIGGTINQTANINDNIIRVGINFKNP